VQSDLQSVRKALKNWLSNASRVVVAGVGNSLRKDDFAGVQLVKSLRKRVSKRIYLIECETVPESFIEPIIEFKPTHVLVIDAALLNLKPGAFKVIKPEKIAGIPVSTHALPLNIFFEYITKMTGAKVALLAIQPKETGFGEGLTEEVGKTVDYLSDLLSKILP
jgi:hydrogenase 3 maturation protease